MTPHYVACCNELGNFFLSQFSHWGCDEWRSMLNNPSLVLIPYPPSLLARAFAALAFTSVARLYSN